MRLSFPSIARWSLCAIALLASIISPRGFAVSVSLEWGITPGPAYLTTGTTERGLAYNPATGNLLLISRSPFVPNSLEIEILSSANGAKIGTLSTTGIAGGTLVLNLIDVADDGVIYAANLTTDSNLTAFTIYRWASEAATPTIAYSGNLNASVRLGDSLRVRASGLTTQIIAGAGTPSRSAFLFTTTDASSFSVRELNVPAVADGDFRFGISFGEGNSFYGNQTTFLRYVKFDPASGATTLLATYNLNVISGSTTPQAVSLANNTLVTLTTSTGSAANRANLYDLALLLPRGPNFVIDNELFPTTNPNAFLTGAIDFTPDGSKVFVLSTSNGIRALNVWPTTVLTVTNTADHFDGSCDATDCTLREAIIAANTNTLEELITFGPGATGVIQLSGALPAIESDLTIRGPGPNRLTIRRNTGGEYRIFNLNGSGASVGPIVKIENLTIANGQVANAGNPNDLGGGIRNDRSTLTLINCVLTGNSAYAGGGLYSTGSSGAALANLRSCTVNGNSASIEGGGIDNVAIGGDTTMTIANSTISANTSSSSGGGISTGVAAGNTAALFLSNCTLGGNSAPTGGGLSNGVAFGGASQVSLRNTLFKAGASGVNIANSGGSFTSQGHNLSSDAAGGDGAAGPGGFLNAAGDIRNTDPLLAPLANNGGPTQTNALLNGSTAINHGDDTYSLTTDQRGFIRTGVSDIGAFELNGIEVRIKNIVRNGANIVVTFDAFAGYRFRLERRLTLGGSNWDDIDGVADLDPAATAAAQFTDPGAASMNAAFYRLRLLP